MEELNFKVKTGAVKVTLTDEFDRVIGWYSFIPTDAEIINRWEEAVKIIKNITLPADASYEDVFEVDNEIKKATDCVLGEGSSEEIYKACSPTTLNQNGDHFYEEVLDSIATVIEKVFNTRVDKRRAKINKALTKYKKK